MWQSEHSLNVYTITLLPRFSLLRAIHASLSRDEWQARELVRGGTNTGGTNVSARYCIEMFQIIDLRQGVSGSERAHQAYCTGSPHCIIIIIFFTTARPASHDSLENSFAVICIFILFCTGAAKCRGVSCSREEVVRGSKLVHWYHYLTGVSVVQVRGVWQLQKPPPEVLLLCPEVVT